MFWRALEGVCTWEEGGREETNLCKHCLGSFAILVHQHLWVLQELRRYLCVQLFQHKTQCLSVVIAGKCVKCCKSMLLKIK